MGARDEFCPLRHVPGKEKIAAVDCDCYLPFRLAKRLKSLFTYHPTSILIIITSAQISNTMLQCLNV